MISLYYIITVVISFFLIYCITRVSYLFREWEWDANNLLFIFIKYNNIFLLNEINIFFNDIINVYDDDDDNNNNNNIYFYKYYKYL